MNDPRGSGWQHLWEPIKWLLEIDLRIKNAVSVLVAPVITTIVFANLSNIGWVYDIIHQHGKIFVFAVLPVTFLVSYLSMWIICSGVAGIWHYCTAQRAAKRMQDQMLETIRHNLKGLTEWQRQFLLRFIVEQRMQMAEFEIGGYKAAWDFELEVLLSKGIVHKHSSASVYEIDPRYHEYLQKNWDPASGTLA